MNKIKKYLLHPSYIIAKLDDYGIVRLNDETKIKMRYKHYMNKKLDLNNPTTFNEKLQWLKIHDRKDIYTKMVDKYEAKKYVADIIGEKYIIPTLGVYDNFDDIDFENLPNQFVIKCTHDSGGLIICKNKNKLNVKDARKKINSSLKKNFYLFGREWPYKNVKPRIIIEKYMVDSGNDDLMDYKFMCFNGKVKCSFVCSERRSDKGLAVDFYDKNWKHMPFERHYRNSEKIIQKPTKYEEMVKLAEILSKNIPFVRVDFYEINKKIYFGELTFFPGCGYEEFKPEEYDKILGDWLELKGDKNNENNDSK